MTQQKPIHEDSNPTNQEALIRSTNRSENAWMGLVTIVSSVPMLLVGIADLRPGQVEVAKNGGTLTREGTIANGFLLCLGAFCFAGIGIALLRSQRVTPYQTARLRHPIALHRLRSNYRRTNNPWLRAFCGTQQWLFGVGSRRPFAWYLTGKSIVQADTIDAICDFLRGCSYATDREQFAMSELWQHPLQFEKRKRGDCDGCRSRKW